MHEPAPSWLHNQGAFRVGLPALDHFPLGVWSRLVGRHARTPSIDMMTYGDPMGHLPLREAIAEYLGAVRAVRCDAAQILVTTGSQQGLQIAAQVLINPGDRVWVEEPGYAGARQAPTQSTNAQASSGGDSDSNAAGNDDVKTAADALGM